MNTDESQEPKVEPNPTPPPIQAPEPTATPIAEPLSQPTSPTTDSNPIAQPQTTVAEEKKTPHVNTPGVIILQWLSYAFWGWLILALIWLMSVIFTAQITGVSVTSIVPYAIAAGVVLLPIAFTTDLFYRKHEPVKKTGAAMIIMVIHAVLFALLAIGSLIVAVFNGLNILISASSNVDAQTIILYTALGATALYIATFTRVLNPFKSAKSSLAYGLGMLAVTVVLLIFAVVGPLFQSLATKDDRRIEQHLGTVSRGVNDYITDNNKLPSSIDQVSFSSEDATSLVKDGLVTYKAETSLPNKINATRTDHRYQLCVTYKQESASRASGYTSYSSNNSYTSYLSTSGHGKGEVCYKVEETTREKSL